MISLEEYMFIVPKSVLPDLVCSLSSTSNYLDGISSRVPQSHLKLRMERPNLNTTFITPSPGPVFSTSVINPSTIRFPKPKSWVLTTQTPPTPLSSTSKQFIKSP